MAAPRFSLSRHRSHDALHLVDCWLKLCDKCGFEVQTLTQVGDYPVIYFRTGPQSGTDAQTIYLSSGVHGDEAAAPWGLLAWAKKEWRLLKKERFLIFPLINPVGLSLNTRLDGKGRDLNRLFHKTQVPGMKCWREEVSKQPLDLGLCLHEDYDAQGTYVYEFAPKKFPIGPKLLNATKAILPIDMRKEIDGRPARKGWIFTTEVPMIQGEPEAVSLFRLGCPRVLTFETPSEFSLDLRVQAHEEFIKSSVQHVLDERRNGGFFR